MAVYLIHSDTPVGGEGRNSAQHYIGWSPEEQLWQRLSEHATNSHRAAKMIRAFHAVGAKLYLVRVWPNGTRALERHLKNVGHYKNRCPMCRPHPRQVSYPLLLTAHALTHESSRLPSSGLVPTGSIPPSGGTPSTKSGSSPRGLSLGSSTLLSAGTPPSVKAPGGTFSTVRATTNANAGGYAGTKQQSRYIGKRGAGYRLS